MIPVLETGLLLPPQDFAMVGRARRVKGSRKLLGSHQRCWIWGRHAVLETIRARKWRPLELRLADHLPPEQLDSARESARRSGIPVVIEPAGALSRHCRSQEHQGHLARMPAYPYDDAEGCLRSLEAALEDAPAAAGLVAVLDAIQDPYNFGAILRSAEVLGAAAVFVGAMRQAEVSSLVARSSAGAVNHLRLAKSADLRALAVRLRRIGYQVVGASEKGTADVFACDFRRPTAIVVGNEAAGIHAELLDRCDSVVRIPQQGRVGSLNAAVSAGILFYEARRQRMEAERGESRPDPRSGSAEAAGVNTQSNGESHERARRG